MARSGIGDGTGIGPGEGRKSVADWEGFGLISIWADLACVACVRLKYFVVIGTLLVLGYII